MHGTRSQKVRPTYTSMISSMLGIVTRARRPSDINPTDQRELLHPSDFVMLTYSKRAIRDFMKEYTSRTLVFAPSN